MAWIEWFLIKKALSWLRSVIGLVSQEERNRYNQRIKQLEEIAGFWKDVADQDFVKRYFETKDLLKEVVTERDELGAQVAGANDLMQTAERVGLMQGGLEGNDALMLIHIWLANKKFQGEQSVDLFEVIHNVQTRIDSMLEFVKTVGKDRQPRYENGAALDVVRKQNLIKNEKIAQVESP